MFLISRNVSIKTLRERRAQKVLLSLYDLSKENGITLSAPSSLSKGGILATSLRFWVSLQMPEPLLCCWATVRREEWERRLDSFYYLLQELKLPAFGENQSLFSYLIQDAKEQISPVFLIR